MRVPPASPVPRVGNKGTLRAVRPDRKNNGIDRQTDVMEQDEASEDGHPGEVQHETRRECEEAEPKRVGKYEGGGRLRNIGDPRLPSKKEVEEHYLTHVPYRNCCLHCVRGRGKDLDHRKALEEDRRIGEFSFDYCFPGDEMGAKITVLVGRERVTGMTMATVVPVKGTSGQFAAMKVLEFVKECGAAETEFILKTDQEPAIDALMADVVKTRGAAITVLEKSPVGSSGSNGVVERGVQGVEGLIRTLLSACEERYGIRIKLQEKLVIFMAEYAAYLINRLEVGKDGKTAYERCRGKRSTVMAIEFGEKLLWKVRQKNKLEKLNPRWEYGVFVGVKVISGEIWVATKEGLQAVRSVRRLSVAERWSESNTEFVRHVPWNKSGEDPDADGELPEAPQAPSAAAFAAVGSVDPPRLIVVNTKETAPREFYIKKKDVEAHGHTKDCPGCRTMFQGGTRQAHTLECRERFRHLMKDEEKVLRTREKRKEYEEKMEEETRRLETKKQRKEEKAEKRGKKREAGDEVMEEEEPSGDVKEARGEKRKAEGDEMELERSGGQVESSGKGMAIEAVMMNDEEAWDDVRGGWLDREKVREARLEEVGYMERKSFGTKCREASRRATG